MLLLTIGTLFCLWIGEKITDKGICIIVPFEVSNSLEVGDVGFILLFLEAVIWLIIIYFTSSI